MIFLMCDICGQEINSRESYLEPNQGKNRMIYADPELNKDIHWHISCALYAGKATLGTKAVERA